jgi:hypothetical protein
MADGDLSLVLRGPICLLSTFEVAFPENVPQFLTCNASVVNVPLQSFRSFRFYFSQHGPTTRPFVERTAEKASMLSDRV